MAQGLGAGKCRHVEVTWLWLQQGMNEKKLSTQHGPTESNIADILTSDRVRKLTNLMGMNLVAGLVCLVQQGARGSKQEREKAPPVQNTEKGKQHHPKEHIS